MSQDEAIWILLGCQVCENMDPGGYVAQYAADMKLKITDYMINYNHLYDLPGDYYVDRILDPDGHPVSLGSNTYSFGFPLSFLNHRPYTTNAAQQLVWLWMSWGSYNDFDLPSSLAAITNSWPNNGAGIIDEASPHNCETFFLLLWEALNNTQLSFQPLQQAEIEKALKQLNDAPCEGPYCYRADDGNLPGIFSGNGWAASYKWMSTKEVQDHGDNPFCGNYNGLDYMFLYNLYHIINYTDCAYYCNYVDKNIPTYLPQKMFMDNFTWATNAHPAKYTAFNSITSSQVIGTHTQPDNTLDPGNVTFVAPSYIHLKPGFHAEEGVYFHAYISDIDCSGEETSGRSMEDTSVVSS
jgi:hypothetical protein